MHLQKGLEMKLFRRSVGTANRSTTLHWHDIENEVKDKDQGPRKSFIKRRLTVDLDRVQVHSYPCSR